MLYSENEKDINVELPYWILDSACVKDINVGLPSWILYSEWAKKKKRYITLGLPYWLQKAEKKQAKESNKFSCNRPHDKNVRRRRKLWPWWSSLNREPKYLGKFYNICFIFLETAGTQQYLVQSGRSLGWMRKAGRNESGRK